MDVPTRSSYDGGCHSTRTPGRRKRHRGTAQSCFVPEPGTGRRIILGVVFSACRSFFCGTLKIIYDVVLLLSFRHIKPPEESV
jgi:hypothetical protein